MVGFFFRFFSLKISVRCVVLLFIYFFFNPNVYVSFICVIKFLCYATLLFPNHSCHRISSEKCLLQNDRMYKNDGNKLFNYICSARALERAVKRDDREWMGELVNDQVVFGASACVCGWMVRLKECQNCCNPQNGNWPFRSQNHISNEIEECQMKFVWFFFTLSRWYFESFI